MKLFVWSCGQEHGSLFTPTNWDVVCLCGKPAVDSGISIGGEMTIQDDVNAIRALLKMIPPDPEFVGVDGYAMLLRILDRLERYEKALREICSDWEGNLIELDLLQLTGRIAREALSEEK